MKIPALEDQSDVIFHGDGESCTVPCTAKFPPSEFMIMIDVQSEWNLSSKSATLRALVRYAYSKMAEEDGKQTRLSGKVKAWLRAAKLLAQVRREEKIIGKICELRTKAVENANPEMRVALEEAAKDLAREYGIGWPPPEPSVLDVKPDTRRVLGSAMNLLSRSEEDRVPLRELSRSTGLNKESLLPILEVLSGEGFLRIDEGQRSGRKTTWIIGPPLTS